MDLQERVLSIFLSKKFFLFTSKKKGKTTTILAIAREMYGKDTYKERVMELNASDERGIDVIREKVKSFAQFTANVKKEDNKKCPPYKLVILDEADSMTNSAQTALRRIMENYSKVTRFCLICNYVSKIIDPLTSRCAKFRFKPLPKEAIISRLLFISKKENIFPLLKQEEEEGGEGGEKEMEIGSDEEERKEKETSKEEKGRVRKVMEGIVEVSRGDLRKGITFLQTANTFYGSEMREEDVREIAGMVPPSFIQQLFRACQSNSFERLEKQVRETIKNGFSAPQVLSQLFDFILNDTQLSNRQKSDCSIYLAQTDRRLLDGSDEFLQLLDALSYLMKQFCI